MVLACLCTVRVHTKARRGHRGCPLARPGCDPAPRAGLRPLLCRDGAGGSSLRQHLLGTCRVPRRCRICARDRSVWRGCPGGLCSAVNVPGGWGVLPPALGELEPLPPSLPLAAPPSDASFPQRRGAAGTGWAAGTGCCPAPAGPEGPPGGSAGQVWWVGVGYLLPMG